MTLRHPLPLVRFALLIACLVPGAHAQDLAFSNDADDRNDLCLRTSDAYSCTAFDGDDQNARDLAAADFDGDGDNDLVVAVWGVNRLCLNEPGTGFVCEDLPSGDAITRSVLAADFNGDGHEDLFLTNSSDPSQVCLNDGSATFTCEPYGPDPFQGPVEDAAAADFDGDGDLDVALAIDGDRSTGRESRACLNDGTGSFTCQIFGDNLPTSSIALGDFDGDADLDLLLDVGRSLDLLCLNDGALGFTCEDFVAGSTASTDVASADLDGDGDADLAFANFQRPPSACLNDGAGVFTCTDVGSQNYVGFGVAVGDLDGDGSPDLAFATLDQPNLACLNDGAGAFTCEELAGSASSYAVVAADFQSTSVAGEAGTRDASFTLAHAGPNPARGAATLALTLPVAQTVRAEAFDVLGRRVAVLHDGPLAPGTHRLRLAAAGLPSGLYLVHATDGTHVRTRRVTLLR